MVDLRDQVQIARWLTFGTEVSRRLDFDVLHPESALAGLAIHVEFG